MVLSAPGADDFEAFCRANSRPCPLLERLPPGCPLTRALAGDADLRTDLPRYRLHSPDGSFEELLDLRDRWRDDLVAMLLGCSFSFEEALTRAGLTPRHVDEGVNVPMYLTSRDTASAGAFGGKLVVSMRPIPRGRVREAYEVTAPYEKVHGAPLHHGEPSALGIPDLSRPDWGDAVTLRPGELPVFWACGVTSHVAVQQALAAGAIDLAITHAPGHMFIADRLNADLTAAGGR